MKAVKQHMHLGTHGVYAFTNTTSKGSDSKLTVVKVDVKEKQGEIASWGSANNRPQEILRAIAKNGTARAGLSVNKKIHYGNGFILLKEEESQDGSTVTPKPQRISQYPEIQEFFNRSNMKRFWKETIADLETFFIAYPEYILSADYNTITRVRRQKTSWCRSEIMQDNGLSENIWISQKWGQVSVTKNSEYVAIVPSIDPYWNAEEVKEYCRKNKITNFIRPCSYTMLDEAYYPMADWHTSIDNGWIDVANSIPEYKKAMFDNQISIKYLVEIDERYFQQIYTRDWDDFSTDERKKIRQDVIDTIDEHLGGNTNAGKSIQSMRIAVGDDKTVPAISITSIDDKFKDGAYLPEASAANSEILFPMNVDPTLIGAGIPGGKLGAGSGSDKREAFLIASTLKKTDREYTLEVFTFIQQYNNWDPDLIGAFENTKLTTLDENPTGSQKVVS